MRVTVIGAGVIGTTTAWFLARQGHAVTLLDRAGGAGMETSFANGGLLHAGHAEPWNAPGVIWQLLRWIGREDSPLLLRPTQLPKLTRWGLGFLRNSRRRHYENNTRTNARLAIYSLKTLGQLRRDTGLHYDDAQNGILKVFRDQESMDRGLQSAAIAEPLGIRHSALDARQATALEPALHDVAHELEGAIYFPDDESGDAHLFTQRLAELARDRGVETILDATVQRLVPRGNRLGHVVSSRGEHEADCFVLAAGSESPLLARQVGLRLPIYPVKGYSVTLPLDHWQDAPVIPLIDDANKVVMSVLGNRIRMAGTAEFAGYDLTIHQQRARSVLQQVLKTLPSLEDHVDESQASLWCGLRPMTMDGPPILGRTRLDNLFLNCGPGHLGWTFACGAAKLVADQVSGRQTDLDMAAFSVDRY